MSMSTLNGFDIVLRLFHLLLSKKKFILLFTLVPTLISVVVVLLTTSIYKSDALIKPPESEGGSSIQSALRESGAGLLGSVLGGSETGGNDCMNILKSTRFASLIIDRFDLEKSYGFNAKQGKYHFADLLKTFQRNAGFDMSQEDGSITISMTDTSADRASEMVSFMIHTLDSLYTDMQRTASQHRLEYVDRRLALVEDEMKEREETLVAFQNRHNLIVPEAQVRLIMENATQTELQIETLKEDIALEGALRGTSSARYQDLQVQKGLLQKTLHGQLRNPSDSNTLILPTNTLPALATEYFRLERSYQIKMSVYKYLVQQVEALKLDANKNVQVISVMDPPWSNDKRIAPKRRVMVETVFILSFILAVFLVVLRSRWQQHVEANPETGKLASETRKSLFRF